MTSDEVLGLETKVSKREQRDADCEIDIGKQNESWLGKCTHYEQLGREANKKYADDRNHSQWKKTYKRYYGTQKTPT